MILKDFHRNFFNFRVIFRVFYDPDGIRACNPQNFVQGSLIPQLPPIGEEGIRKEGLLACILISNPKLLLLFVQEDEVFTFEFLCREVFLYDFHHRGEPNP